MTSSMLDQADRLRELVRRSGSLHSAHSPRARRIAIGSGPSDDGAPQLIACLGRQLARMDQRVVLVDADLAAPRLTRMLGAIPGPLDDVLQGTRRASESLSPLDERLELVAGSAATQGHGADGAAWRRLAAEMASLELRCDVLLVATGNGMSPWIDQLWQTASEVVMLCHRDAQSLQRAYQSLKMSSASQLDGRVRLVVADCDDLRLVRIAGDRMAATCERFLGMRLRETLGLTPCAGEETRYLRSVRALAAELLWEAEDRHRPIAMTANGPQLGVEKSTPIPAPSPGLMKLRPVPGPSPP